MVDIETSVASDSPRSNAIESPNPIAIESPNPNDLESQNPTEEQARKRQRLWKRVVVAAFVVLLVGFLVLAILYVARHPQVIVK